MRTWAKSLIGVLTAGALVFIFTCWSFLDDSVGYVPLPELADGEPIVLRVAVIENPDLATFTEDEWRAVLSVAAETSRRHFGIDLEFSGFQRLSLPKIFQRIDNAIPSDVQDRIAPFRSPDMDWDRLVEMVVPTLPKDSVELVSALNYLKQETGRNLGALSGSTVEERRRSLAELGVRVLRERLDGIWRETPTRLTGGETRRGKPGYNEWVYWDALPALDLPFDIYLTNQAVISVEYAQYPLHIITRGGITAGTTSGANEASFGAASWISAFPFLDESREVVALRDGEIYAREEAILYAGQLLAHELGHLLFHLSHPWGDDDCIMYPVPGLRFHEAAVTFDAESCPLGRNPAMTPGAVQIPKPGFAEE